MPEITPPAGTPAAPPAPQASPDGAAAPQQPTLLVDPKPAAPADGSKDGGVKTPDAAPADIKIKLPEGFTASDSQKKVIGNFEAFAKEHKLPQEAAQKFFDQYVQQQQADVQESQTKRQETITQWAEDAKKEFGVKFDSTLTTAKKALARFGDPEITQILTDSGLGNHKGVIRLLAKIGEKIGEDKQPSPGAGPVEDKGSDAALRSLYSKSPEMFSKQQ